MSGQATATTRAAIHEELRSRKAKIGASITRASDKIDEVIQRCILNGNARDLKGLIPEIAYQNISVSISAGMSAVGVLKGRYTFFVHGSTGKGEGQIAPNLDYSIFRTTHGVRIQCDVIPNCRDDIDCIAVCDEVPRAVSILREACEELAKREAVQITCNVVSFDSVSRETMDKIGSPALRRILVFNRPKCIIGRAAFDSVTRTAMDYQTEGDFDNELDFRLLMQVSDILEAFEIVDFTFEEDEVLAFFPAFHRAEFEGLHTGFPRERIKIVCGSAGSRTAP